MIVWDNGTKKQRVYEIWEDNFHDPVSYANFYFNEVYGKNEVLLNEEMSADENLVKGMLHLNPYTLHVKGQPAEAKYIVGVATAIVNWAMAILMITYSAKNYNERSLKVFEKIIEKPDIKTLKKLTALR